MAGYRYGGTEFDAHLPVPYPEPKAREFPSLTDPREPSECGTDAGHNAHRRKKEPVCDPCRLAHNEYQCEYKRRRRAGKIPTGWTAAKCGTLAGVAAHYRHAVPVCLPCRIESRARAKELRAAKKKAA